MRGSQRIQIRFLDKVKARSRKAEKPLLVIKKYKGTVDKVSKIAIPNEKGNTSGWGQVYILTNPDDEYFYWCGIAKVTHSGHPRLKNVPVLPVEVVNIGKEGSFCYVVNKGKIERKKTSRQG